MEEEDYWNTSDNKAYSFEDVDVSIPSNLSIICEIHLINLEYISQIQPPRITNKLIDDSISEASYDLPQNDLNLDAIISYYDLQMSMLKIVCGNRIRFIEEKFLQSSRNNRQRDC